MAYLKTDSEVPLKGKGSKLRGKMAAFVDEYFVDFVAYKAILRAGYKTKYPEKMASELMLHPLVKQEIEKRQNERREKLELTADYVLQKLQRIVEDTETQNPQAALRGLELIGKHLGMYKDRQEISGPNGDAIRMEQKVKQDVADFTSRLARLAKPSGEGNVVELPDRRTETGT